MQYSLDLESRLDASRARELSLSEEVERARLLVSGLQKENAVLLDREREMMAVQEQLHERAFPRVLEEIAAAGDAGGDDGGQQQQQQQQQHPMSAEMQEHKMARVLGMNEALQDKVREMRCWHAIFCVRVQGLPFFFLHNHVCFVLVVYTPILNPLHSFQR